MSRAQRIALACYARRQPLTTPTPPITLATLMAQYKRHATSMDDICEALHA